MARTIISPVLVLAVAALTSGCGQDPEASGSDTEARSVRVASVEIAQGARELRISGITRAARRATLAFLVSGTLTERSADLGTA
ncbi:MAG: efflux RND transporter periplasmic adaptor subunit, partial [Gammaproteobacteria bacterium]